MGLGATRSDNLTGERFRAFVSYSHADAKTAQKLHRKIEIYRLPKHLRGRGGDDGDTAQDDGRIGRIFRDREDLPAAQDLSAAVKAALEASEALIVLCSPEAKASLWVAKEIELFRELHPDRPILAAIVRGEPEECFPEPLLGGQEPLAADLRKEGDGWRLGFLKVIAGIADVPLDALVQRDAQRRIRRVTAVTGGALVALLAMIGMTIFAVQQRNEAQHQQAQAEGLVDYMLDDLREDLKGVGRLDVMTDVNERAMKYYEAQDDLSDMPAESLERRAKILHAWGEDDEKRGDLDKALVKFTEAHRTTEALLAQDPENPDRIFGHGQSEYWVGRIAELKEDWSVARKRYQAYAASAKTLVSIDSDNPSYLMEMGWGRLNLGIVDLKPRVAPLYGQENFKAAIEWMKRAQVLEPDDVSIRKEIGNAYAWLADSHYLALDKQAYIDARYQELHAKENWLKREPSNSSAKYAVAKAKFAIAAVSDAEKRGTERREFLTEAKNMMQQLVRLDRTNLNWTSMAKKIELEFQKREKSDE